MPPSPQEIDIRIPNLRLAARAWGPEDGRPVLALHGWLDNAASFDPLAARLPGLRLVALDMPGHGLSDHLGPGELYGFIDTVVRVHEVTLSLGWDRYGLLGHSLGAAVASILAGTFPDRVERMVLVEGLGPLTEDPEHAAERLARSIGEQVRKRGHRSPRYPSVDAAAELWQRAVGRLSAQGARRLVERGLREVPGEGMTWRSDPRLRVPSRVRLTEAQVLAFLRAVTAPTLVIRGTEGSPFAPAPMSARLAALADVTVIERPGGHHVHLDAAESVAEPIGAFLRGG